MADELDVRLHCLPISLFFFSACVALEPAPDSVERRGGPDREARGGQKVKGGGKKPMPEPTGTPAVATSHAHDPSVAIVGTAAVVGWQSFEVGDDPTLSFRWIQDAQPSTTWLLTDQGRPTGVAMAGRTSDAAAVWADGDGASRGIWTARVATSGAVGDAISLTSSAAQFPAIATRGDEALVAWSDGSGIGVAAMSATWTQGASDQVGHVTANTPSVGAGDSGYLVAWADFRAGYAEVWGRRYDTSGVGVGEEFMISAGGNATWPQVTFDGASYRVSYFQVSYGPFRMEHHVAVVAADGTVAPNGVMSSAPTFDEGSAFQMHTGATLFAVAAADAEYDDVDLRVGDGVSEVAIETWPSVSFAGGSPNDDQRHPAVALGSDGGVVTWHAPSMSGSEIRVVTTDRFATPDGAPWALSPAPQ